MPSLAAFEKIESSFCCSACRRQSSFRLLTNASLLHPLLEIRCQSQGAARGSNDSSISSQLFSGVQSIVSLVHPIVMAMGYVLMTVGQLLYTICYIFGLPIDACLNSVQQAYATIRRYIVNVYTRITGFFPTATASSASSQRNPGDIESPTDPTNTNATATQRSRLVSVPTVISSTPFTRPQTSTSVSGSDSHGSMSHQSTSSSLANAAMRLGGSSFANYGGYEMVSQDIPESHATNSPLQPSSTSTAATASQRASTMLETMDEDVPPVVATAPAATAASKTSSSTTGATKASTADNNVQYYHRSKQTSRLLNPELYSGNANNNSGTSSNNSNTSPRPSGQSGPKSTTPR